MRQAAGVARLALDSYVRSGWVIGDVLLVVVLIAISTSGSDPRSAHPVAAYFFGLHSVDFVAASILGTVLLVRRSLGLRSLVVLSRLRSRTAYPAGLALAAGVLRVPQLALLVALGAATGHLPAADLVAVPAASVGLLANALLAVAVTVALLSPFSGRRELLGALLYAAAALVPVTGLPPLAAHLQGVVQLPLWPLSVNGQASSVAALTPPQLAAVPLTAAAAVLVLLAAGRRFRERDVLLG